MREIRNGIYQWSKFSEPKGLDFNGHLVVSGEDRVLIDPPEISEEDRHWIRRQGPISCILLTNRDHIRCAESFRESFSAPIRIHSRDASGVSIRIDATLNDFQEMPGGLVAIPVPDGKSPGEIALLLARDGGTLVLGDALIGKPPGSLAMLPAEKFADADRAREGIRSLLEQPFEAILVGDGASIPVGGREALQRFLQS